MIPPFFRQIKTGLYYKCMCAFICIIPPNLTHGSSILVILLGTMLPHLVSSWGTSLYQFIEISLIPFFSCIESPYVDIAFSPPPFGGPLSCFWPFTNTNDVIMVNVCMSFYELPVCLWNAFVAEELLSQRVM